MPRYSHQMKTTRARSRILVIAGSAVGAFAIFCGSVALFGAWWRFENMPTAEEWQGLFGATVLVAIGLTLYQIRQVDASNRELIRSNELARDANLEISRPRVQVYLQADRQVWKDRTKPVDGTMFVAVTNIGRSPATNVRLAVDIPFTSMEEFFKPGMMATHFEDLNSTFDGSTRFPILNPRSTYVWFFARVPRVFEAGPEMPRQYRVTARYESSSGVHYVEEMILDLDVEKRLELPAPPLRRIGRDIEIVGDELKAIRKELKSVRSGN